MWQRRMIARSNPPASPDPKQTFGLHNQARRLNERLLPIILLLGALAMVDQVPAQSDVLRGKDLLQSCVAQTEFCYAQILVEWKGSENLKAEAGTCLFDIPTSASLRTLRDKV